MAEGIDMGQVHEASPHPALRELGEAGHKTATSRAESRSTLATLAARTVIVIAAITVQRHRLFGQLPGRNKLKGPGSRLLVSPFPEIKFILFCCRVL
jgi:hypothetical protein